MYAALVKFKEASFAVPMIQTGKKLYANLVGESGEHWYYTVVSDHRQILFIARNVRYSRANSSENFDMLRLE
jgi:hypothetical protein